MKRTYGMMRRRPKPPPRYRRAPVRKSYIPRPVCQNIVLRRTFEFSPFSIPTTTDTWQSANYAFKLSDLPAVSEFTTLFDQFRILSVKISWIPRFRHPLLGVVATGGSGLGAPNIWVAPAEDGTQNLTSKLESFQCNAAKRIVDPYKEFSLVIKPKAQIEVATAAAIAGAAPKWGMWMDTQNSGVNYYGASIGGYMPQQSGSTAFNPFIYTVYAELTIELKNPK